MSFNIGINIMNKLVVVTIAWERLDIASYGVTRVSDPNLIYGGPPIAIAKYATSVRLPLNF